MFRRLKQYMPKGLLWRLTSLNIIIIALAVILIGWAVYETACSLTAGMGEFGDQRQQQFNATLLQYVIIFMTVGIVVGIVLHLYFTKKIIRPIKQLIDSTKSMKSGNYPEPLDVESQGELADLVEQFNGMVEQLESNEEQRKKLITDLSHEIRTPLANINGYLQALHSGVITGDEQLYASLYSESKRLTDMVEQLDELKEWDHEQSRISGPIETVNIADHVNQCIDMFGWTLDEQGIDIHVVVEKKYLIINPSGIQQVLSNIVQNAIHYYDGKEPIVVTGEEQKQNACYKVSISGPSEPIPNTVETQLFDRFYRADSSRSRETGGTGLGLAIAKEIVEHHNGQIGIDTHGHVNTIWFTLPFE